MKKIIAVVGLFLGFAPVSHATVLDLTTAGSSGTINGGFFQQIDSSSTGTGVIQSFAEVGGNTNTVHAYNTTDNGTLDNGSSDVFNHELLLSTIPIVNLSGTDYRQFLLDVNQTGNAPLLSLDEIQIFQSSTANQSVTTFTSGVVDLSGNLIYRLDAGSDNYIKLDYSLNTGSGSGDMFAYIPNSNFTGNEQYVYLYSKFGVNNSNNDGFEEWATLKGSTPTSAVPEPQTLALLSPALLGLFFRRKIA